MESEQVYLFNSEASQLVEAELHEEINDSHLRLWSHSWVPLMKQYRKNPRKENPEDSHWDWRKKVKHSKKLISYQSYSLTCAGELQGLMCVKSDCFGKLNEQFSKPLVYVDFISTAPWNRSDYQNTPRYKGIGSVFIMVAIQASIELGYKGRIGLHSLPAAEMFYGVKCGMSRLGADSGYEGLTYFEMTEQQANNYSQ